MNNSFLKVKNYLLDLEYSIINEIEDNQVFVISKEEEGIKNMVIACADPILIMEQYLFELKGDDKTVYVSLLKKNRDIIHGAFVLDDTGKKVIFRDTLELENLDKNELEGSISSLSLLLSEFSDDIMKYKI